MLLKVLILICLVGIINAQEWSHADVGNWSSLFPQCGGSRQSPINIVTRSVDTRLSLRLRFNNFAVNPTTMTWLNDGHSAVLQPTYGTNRPTIQNLENGETYVVDALHYHWGPDNNVGSEHTINGVSYPLEVHIVSWNQRYGSLANAVSSPNGLLVIGNFYTVSDSIRFVPLRLLVEFWRLIFGTNNYYMRLLPNIFNYSTSFTFTNTISLLSILRRTPINYYFYSGSLTTPTCDETVQWVVNEMPIYITPEDLLLFRNLRDKDGNPITSNFRPVQPLNGRSVGFGCL